MHMGGCACVHFFIIFKNSVSLIFKFFFLSRWLQNNNNSCYYYCLSYSLKTGDMLFFLVSVPNITWPI